MRVRFEPISVPVVIATLLFVGCDPAEPSELADECEANPDCVDGVPPERMSPDHERSQPTAEQAFPAAGGPVEVGYLRTADGVVEVSARRVGDLVAYGGDLVAPADEFYANFFATAEQALAGPQLPDGVSAAAIRPLGSGTWTGTIPFTLDPSLDDHGRVYDAIAKWEARTPFRFSEQASCTAGSCLVFTDGDGCSSQVGRQTGPQAVTIENGHCDSGNTLHEIGHALGFRHEQTRTDRDTYVDILWENIESGKESNFERYVDAGLSGIDLGPYDFDSVMHYPKDAFGTRVWGLLWKRTTIETRYGESIGQRDHLSIGDVGAAFLRWAPQVTVFRDRDYAGVWQTFANPGEYRANRNELATVGNDQISSLVVPPGFEVTVCAHETAGPCETFRGSKTFVGTTLNDNISRIVIEDDPGPPNPGYCGCQNSGLGNVCVQAIDQCTDGFSPVCSPSRGSGGSGCGGCICQ